MRWTYLALVVAACGGEHNQHTGVDAILPDTGGSIDGLPAGCDYVEKNDAGNDDIPPSVGVAETTGLTVGTKTTICGAFQAGHYDSDFTVDVDGFTVQVAADTDVIVRLSGMGIETLDYSGVDVYGGAMFDQHVGGNTFYGDHGVTGLHLAPGAYKIQPFAVHSQATTADISYKLELATDSLATRCALLTTGGFAEANDGAGSTGNDVVGFSGGPSLTASTADAPEASGIMTSPSSTNRISGSAADVTVADDYEDKDTYAFSTGGANELTLRLAWSGTANLDVFVFEAGSTTVVDRQTTTTVGAENSIVSLKRNSSYWLWVAAKTATGLPAPYSATLCGGNY